MRDNPIFIVGAGRSGTGLLRDLLRSHPRLSFPPESHFIPPFYRAYGDPRSDPEARRLAAAILSRSRLRNWDLDLSPEDFEYCRSFSEVTAHIFRWWADREGRPRWGDKTPAYVTQIPLLAELFPDAQFVHIYRDGRDVALSRLRRLWGPRNVVTAAMMWRTRVTSGRCCGVRLSPGRYLELSYERLVKEPEATMRGVCEFLGEEFVPGVLVPTRRPLHVASATSSWQHPGYDQQITAASVERWRNGMDARDRVLFERVAGELLAKLGYPVLSDVRPLTRTERALWRAHDFMTRVGGLRHRPPVEFRNPIWLRPALAAERLRSGRSRPSSEG